MWTRLELKTRAKNVLRGIYWEALLVAVIVAFAGGMDGGGSSGGGGNRMNNTMNSHGGMMSPEFWGFMAMAAGIALIIGLVVMALRVFVGYPLEIGGKRFFVKAAKFEDRTGGFAFAFSGENYRSIVTTMLVKGIFNFLWYLALIIPGIIKSYAYRMVPYILAENPNIGPRRAIELSNEMTRGHKWDMFVLDLSFIGWYLLGLLAFIIGTFFVMPYELATKAELYLVLKRNAIENGMCSLEELPL